MLRTSEQMNISCDRNMAWEKTIDTIPVATPINSQVLIRMNPKVRNHILLGVYFHDNSIVVVFIPNF